MLPESSTARAVVIIPNWNGAAYLPTCLESLRRQCFRDFTVTVVDNASRDSSLELLRRDFPEVTALPLSRNMVFSGAVNEGIKQSRGELVVLLNNDVEAHEAWLGELVRSLDEHPEAGMAASKMLLFDRRQIIHSAGDLYRHDGVPVNRGVWQEDLGQYDADVAVFGACGGAAAYRRTMLEELGFFDEDFVAYCEDVDLAFRAQLAGYTAVFAPRAVVYHRLSATGGGPLASYYCGRNFVNVLVKNMPSSLLRQHGPAIIGAQFGYVRQSLRHIRESAARARLRGQAAGLLMVPKMLRKRRQIQGKRKVPDSYIASILAPTEPAGKGGTK